MRVLRGRHGSHPAGEPDQLAAGPSGWIRAQPHGLGHQLPGLLFALAWPIPAVQGFAPRMHGQPQPWPAHRLGGDAQIPMERRLLVDGAGIELHHQPAPGAGVVERTVSQSPVEPASAGAGHGAGHHQPAAGGIAPTRPAPGPSRAGVPFGETKPFRIGQQRAQPLHRALLWRRHRAAVEQIHQPAHPGAFHIRHTGRPMLRIGLWPAFRRPGRGRGFRGVKVRLVRLGRRLPGDFPRISHGVPDLPGCHPAGRSRRGGSQRRLDHRPGHVGMELPGASEKPGMNPGARRWRRCQLGHQPLRQAHDATPARMSSICTPACSR